MFADAKVAICTWLIKVCSWVKTYHWMEIGKKYEL